MRKTLRVIAVAGVWTAISFAGPAAHADHVQISWTSCSQASPTPSGSPKGGSPTATPTATPAAGSPAQNCLPASRTRIAGVRTLAFSVSSSQTRPIREVRLYVESREKPAIPDGNAGQPIFLEAYSDPSAAPPTKDYQNVSWDTVIQTPHNGKYALRLEVLTHGQGHQPAPVYSHELIVDNPPRTPAAPRIVAKEAAKITVEWDTAPEPDVLDYKLFRARTDKADKAPPYDKFAEVFVGKATTERDDVKETGVYWYYLTVRRRSFDNESGITSAPSPISKSSEVKSLAVEDPDDAANKTTTGRVVPRARIISRLPNLSLPSVSSRAPPVPDAPFSAFLPYDVPEGGEVTDTEEPGGGDPRGPVLPVAVGAFLVSSALALGRMPY